MKPKTMLYHEDWVLKKRIEESSKEEIYNYVKKRDKTFFALGLVFLLGFVVMVGFMAYLESNDQTTISQDTAVVLGENLCKSLGQGELINLQRFMDEERINLYCENKTIILYPLS